MRLAVLILFPLQFAVAQTTLPPGSRVRVMKISERYEPRLTGLVVSSTADSALVDLKGPTSDSPPTRTMFPLTRLEISTGYRPRTTDGSIRGLLIGGAIGWGLATAISSPKCGDAMFCLPRGGTLRVVVPVTGMVGLLFGESWGSNRKREHWAPVVARD